MEVPTWEIGQPLAHLRLLLGSIVVEDGGRTAVSGAGLSPALRWRLVARRAVRIPGPKLPRRRHVALWNRCWTPSPTIPPSLTIPAVSAASVAPIVPALVLPGIGCRQPRRGECQAQVQAQAGSEQPKVCHDVSPYPYVLEETRQHGSCRVRQAAGLWRALRIIAPQAA